MREATLAQRLGKTCHVSPLRMKLQRLQQQFPTSACDLEDWLVDVANARGARIVTRGVEEISHSAPDLKNLPNEELVIGLLLSQNRDRPQMFRLAGQLISRKAVDFRTLVRVAVHERVEFCLAELARQALRVDPEHSLWHRIHEEFQAERAPASALIHYTRLAQPVMMNNRANAEKWVLVS